jgi:hypothetical protein
LVDWILGRVEQSDFTTKSLSGYLLTSYILRREDQVTVIAASHLLIILSHSQASAGALATGPTAGSSSSDVDETWTGAFSR